MHDYSYDYSSSGFIKNSSFSSFGSKTEKASTLRNSFATSQTKSASNNIYKVGMQVTHKTFGTGMILSVTQTGGDYMLEIAFDKVGTKKIMANYAKLTV